MRNIVLIIHDVRSTHNVGSLLRTADCMGVSHVYFSGYTPYPTLSAGQEDRLPHIHEKLTKQIHKTALGAESSVAWSVWSDLVGEISRLKTDGFRIVGLEQHERSIPLPDYRTSSPVAMLIGREVEGIEQPLLDLCDDIVEIPQFGAKESLNVVQATAITLYHLRFA